MTPVTTLSLSVFTAEMGQKDSSVKCLRLTMLKQLGFYSNVAKNLDRILRKSAKGDANHCSLPSTATMRILAVDSSK